MPYVYLLILKGRSHMIKKVMKGKNRNKYQIRIQPTDSVTGKRISWPVQYADTKKAAVKIERQMWQEYESGLNLNDSRVVFAEDFQRYVDQRAKSISPVTVRSWQNTANSVKKYFKNAQIKQITTQLIESYAHDYVKNHHATVSRSSNIAKILVHLRNYFKSLEGKVIKENPVPENALKVFFKKSDFTVPQEWRIFTKSELKQIRNLIMTDLQNNPVQLNGSKLAILIESYTGMRVGELQALKFSDIVQEKGYWTFSINDSWSDYTNSFNGSLKARPKGYSRTLLPVPENVIDQVKEYQVAQKKFLTEYNLSNPLDLIFLSLHDYKRSSNYQPVRQKSINDMLKEICTKLSIESEGKQMSLYSFRHTVCTQLASTPEMSYPWAAEKMGHSLNMFMKTYVGLSQDIEQKMNQLWVS